MSHKYKLLEQNKVIPATFDKIFKSIWQDERNKNLLSYMISFITKLNKKALYNNMVFKNTELPKANFKEKGMITDLLITSLKTLFNLEMNKTPDKGRIKKNNGYAHKLAIETSKTNGKYNKLIQINFNDSVNFDNELSSEYMMRSRDGKTCADENYIIHHISMVKIVYKYYNNNRLNKFEKAIVMMYTDDKKVLEELSKGDEDLMKLKETIEEKSRDDEIIGLYNEKEMQDYVNQINLEDSHEEGYKIGKEAGKKEGLKEGKENALIETAKRFLNLGISVKDIAQGTGLTEKEINNLSKSL